MEMKPLKLESVQCILFSDRAKVNKEFRYATSQQ